MNQDDFRKLLGHKSEVPGQKSGVPKFGLTRKKTAGGVNIPFHSKKPNESLSTEPPKEASGPSNETSRDDERSSIIERRHEIVYEEPAVKGLDLELLERTREEQAREEEEKMNELLSAHDTTAETTTPPPAPETSGKFKRIGPSRPEEKKKKKRKRTEIVATGDSTAAASTVESLPIPPETRKPVETAKAAEAATAAEVGKLSEPTPQQEPIKIVHEEDLDDDFDIFADVGEYKGYSDSDSDSDGPESKKSVVAEPSASSSKIKYFEDDGKEDDIVLTTVPRQVAELADKQRAFEQGLIEDNPVDVENIKLTPLSNSTSIKDLLSMDDEEVRKDKKKSRKKKAADSSDEDD